MSALRMGTILAQHFDTATLSATVKALSAVPLRRAGVLTEMVIAGVGASLADKADQPALVIWGSKIGALAASARVVTDIVISREPPFPFDFLATQPILAAVPLRQAFPCVENVLYQPWRVDEQLYWQRMRELAKVWLKAGRCVRVVCGQVEPGDGEYRGQWQVLEQG